MSANRHSPFPVEEERALPFPVEEEEVFLADKAARAAAEATMRQDMASCWRRALDEDDAVAAAMWIARGAMLGWKTTDRDNIVNQTTVLAHYLWGAKSEGDSVLRTMVDSVPSEALSDTAEDQDPFRLRISQRLRDVSPANGSSAWYATALDTHIAGESWGMLREIVHSADEASDDAVWPLQCLTTTVKMLMQAGPFVANRTLQEAERSGAWILDHSESRLHVAERILYFLSKLDRAALNEIFQNDEIAMKQFHVFPPSYEARIPDEAWYFLNDLTDRVTVCLIGTAAGARIFDSDDDGYEPSCRSVRP